VILAEPENLSRLSKGMDELDAVCIAVPPFSEDYLDRGHAIHFRCRRKDVAGIRIDVMSVLRVVDGFEDLWARRTTVTTESGDAFDLLALPDLVQAKKTQRDKDWPMLRRLIEANYEANRQNPNQEQIRFWLREARTPSIVVKLATEYPVDFAMVVQDRPLLGVVRIGGVEAVQAGLAEEEATERARDREYWAPLVSELERIRHDHVSGRGA